MGRNSERGQMIIEVVLLTLVFTGLFLLAIGICETGERAEQQHRFQSRTLGALR
jgi:hypothetical protein